MEQGYRFGSSQPVVKTWGGGKLLRKYHRIHCLVLGVASGRGPGTEVSRIEVKKSGA